MPKVELLTRSILETPSPVSVFFAFKDSELPKELKEVDKKVSGLLSRIMKEESFEGKAGQFFMFHAHQRGLKIDRLIVVGLGDKKKMTLRHLANHFGSALRLVQKKKISKVSVSIPQELNGKFGNAELAKELTETAFVSPYQFGHYKSKKEDILPDLAELVICEPQKKYHKDITKGIEEGLIVGRFMNLVRDAGNQPSSTATPTYMANMAWDIAKDNKSVKVKVLGRDEMKKLKMGGLLGVSQGSEEPAKFIVLEYMGNPKSKDIYAFVGKAITFDSGGISLKPGEKMEDMKYDMSGGGAVITSIGAIAALKLPLNIVGCVPATENLPSGRAYKPGDILVAMNGKSMEVQNTDAEGRLILSDGLSYATMTYKPKAVVDLATLTGACVIALGEHAAGLMGNDQKWIDRVKQAGETSGDRTWQLPLWSEYHEQIKSDFADIRNIGGRPAGTITAAAFLSNFVGETPWAHVDIAATAWHDNEKPYMKKGATGFGLRLLVELAKDLAGKKK
jgi:leucyl aminopeptidase